MEKIYIRAASKSEVSCIPDFLINHFDKDNPLIQSYIYPQDDNPESIEFTFDEAVAEGNVLMAFETSTNILVGVLIARIIDSKSEAANQVSEGLIAKENINQKFDDIVNFLNFVTAKANVCQRFKVDQHFHIGIVGVHQNYRKQNIAKRLFESGIDLARSRNFKLVSVDCVNIYSSKVAERLGMECASTVTYDEYSDYLGKRLFVPIPPHDEIKSFIKKI